MERMSKTMAEGKEDLERAFNIMNEELIKAEYKARVGYYGKYMDEIMEEVAKETKSYKQLEEENKKLKSDLSFERTMLDNVKAEYKSLQNVIKKLKAENETLKEELISRIRQPKNVPYGKGVAEFMEEDTLQELRDLGEI